MIDIRVQESSDGVCTVYIGHQVIVAGLSRHDASSLVEAYRRQTDGVIHPSSRPSLANRDH